MRTLWHSITWELTLAWRNQLVTVTVLVSAFYLFLLSLLPEGLPHTWLALLIFTDPAMLGFLFIGGMVLWEKQARTFQVWGILPTRPLPYLGGKVIALSLIAWGACLVLAWAGHSGSVNWLHLSLGALEASCLFALIGFIGVARINSLNQYLLVVPLLLTPLLLPILNTIGLTDTVAWYLIPSQAILLLLEGAFRPLSTGDLLYAWLYPWPWIALIYAIAQQSYLKHVAKS